MPRPRLRLAATLPTFLFGASLDYYLRAPGAFRQCCGIGGKHAIVFVLDHPLTCISHPSGTIQMLQSARRRD